MTHAKMRRRRRTTDSARQCHICFTVHAERSCPSCTCQECGAIRGDTHWSSAADKRVCRVCADKYEAGLHTETCWLGHDLELSEWTRSSNGGWEAICGECSEAIHIVPGHLEERTGGAL